MVPYASVIIPTRNGMPLVANCLQTVLAQETPWSFEVIVIDSGSADGTWELLESLPVKRIQIPPQSFNHGGTRNLGASTARGQFLVFLVQDAVASSSSWLRRLVTAAEGANVAGSYGRELPWPADSPLVWLHMEQAFPHREQQALQQLKRGQSWEDLSPGEKLATASFHNTCSCMRREIWEKHPFRCLPYGEDIDWGVRVVQAGYAVAYEPTAAVYHSHDRSCWYELKRAYADHELVMRLLGYHAFPRLSGLAASWVRSTALFMRAIMRESRSPSEKLRLLLRAPVVIAARHCGSYLGAQAVIHRSYTWRLIERPMRKGV